MRDEKRTRSFLRIIVLAVVIGGLVSGFFCRVINVDVWQLITSSLRLLFPLLSAALAFAVTLYLLRHVVAAYLLRPVGRLNRARHLMSLHSGYLQEYGWYLELDGRRVATLAMRGRGLNGQVSYEYALRHLTKDRNVQRQITNGGFWDTNRSRIKLRSRLTREVVDDDWVRGGFWVDTDGVTWVSLRGVGIVGVTRTCWDEWPLWRSRKRIESCKRRVLLKTHLR